MEEPMSPRQWVVALVLDASLVALLGVIFCIETPKVHTRLAAGDKNTLVAGLLCSYLGLLFVSAGWLRKWSVILGLLGLWGRRILVGVLCLAFGIVSLAVWSGLAKWLSS